MATYLVIKNGSETKSYTCKSTYTGTPYLKVDTAYLDLTTNLTKTGLRTKIDNKVYMPMEGKVYYSGTSWNDTTSAVGAHTSAVSIFYSTAPFIYKTDTVFSLDTTWCTSCTTNLNNYSTFESLFAKESVLTPIYSGSVSITGTKYNMSMKYTATSYSTESSSLSTTSRATWSTTSFRRYTIRVSSTGNETITYTISLTNRTGFHANTFSSTFGTSLPEETSSYPITRTGTCRDWNWYRATYTYYTSKYSTSTGTYDQGNYDALISGTITNLYTHLYRISQLSYTLDTSYTFTTATFYSRYTLVTRRTYTTTASTPGAWVTISTTSE